MNLWTAAGAVFSVRFLVGVSAQILFRSPVTLRHGFTSPLHKVIHHVVVQSPGKPPRQARWGRGPGLCPSVTLRHEFTATLHKQHVILNEVKDLTLSGPDGPTLAEGE